nr:hypothetical protein BaRGS_023535 [Batillaria attramentaria]
MAERWTSNARVDGGGTEDERAYKRVAIVEEFFHIIYNVHVEMDGRGGKHAGQKRTYRATEPASDTETAGAHKGRNG